MDVRADVDGRLKNLYGTLAEDLKDRLNAWDAKWNPPEANLLFDTVRAFAAGMEAAGEFAQNYVHVMKAIVHGASRDRSAPRVGLKSHSIQSKSAQSADWPALIRLDLAIHDESQCIEPEWRMRI